MTVADFYTHFESCAACKRVAGRLCPDGARMHAETVQALTDRLAPPPLVPRGKA